MKTICLFSAVFMVAFSACQDEIINEPTMTPGTILVTYDWRLIEVITKEGTFDPFAEVAPEKITVSTEGCHFSRIIDFLIDNTYTVYSNDPDCPVGSEEGANWELQQHDTIMSLRFFSPGLSSNLRITNITEKHMMLSSSAIGIHTGERWAYLYVYESL